MKWSSAKKYIVYVLLLGIGIYAGFMTNRSAREDVAKLSQNKNVENRRALENRRAPLTQHRKISEKEQGDSRFDKLLREIADKNSLPNMESTLEKLKAIYRSNNNILANAYELEDILWRKWAVENPQAMIAYAEKNDEWSRVKEALRIWSENSPKEASQYYLQHKEKLYNDRLLFRNILRNWGKNSPEEAWECFSTLRPIEQEENVSGLLEGILSAHSGELGMYLSRLSPNKTTKEGIGKIVLKWGIKDYQSARQWLDSLPAEERKVYDRYRHGMMALHDMPALEAELEGRPINERGEAFQTVVDGFSEAGDYQAAADYMLKRNEEIAREGDGNPYLNFVFFSSWVASDFETARNWVLTLPQGQMRDKAICEYAIHSNSPYYEETANLALSVKNEEDREDALKRALDFWKERDLNDAHDWVNKHGAHLSDKLKERLLQDIWK